LIVAKKKLEYFETDAGQQALTSEFDRRLEVWQASQPQKSHVIPALSGFAMSLIAAAVIMTAWATHQNYVSIEHLQNREQESYERTGLPKPTWPDSKEAAREDLDKAAVNNPIFDASGDLWVRKSAPSMIVRAKAPCWLSVKEGDHQHYEGTVPAGWVYKLSPPERTVWTIRAGCPGELEYEQNGKLTVPTNMAEHPRDVELTRWEF
jgi:hypothetical protein